jgi:hypothetical protein
MKTHLGMQILNLGGWVCSIFYILTESRNDLPLWILDVQQDPITGPHPEPNELSPHEYTEFLPGSF